jgi:pyruvate formate lyase activating enzyme
VVRDWYHLEAYGLTEEGRCESCGTAIAGRYARYEGQFGPRRIPVRLGA